MESEKKLEVIHPYCAIGGGKNGNVHSADVTVERHEFLVALPHEKRRYVYINGNQLYYARIWGGICKERRNDEQPPIGPTPLIRLIFVQGLAGTHANWFPQLEYFAKDERFDIVAVDCRGVGLSDSPKGRWRTSDMADDMVELVKHLGWESGCHFLGYSLGGMVALEAALDRPDLFKSVALISTHAGGLLGTILPPWGILPFLRTFSQLGSVDAIDRGMELLHTSQYLDSDVADHDQEKIAKVAREVLGTNDRVTNRFKVAVELIRQARKYVEGGVPEEIRMEGTLKQIAAEITHHVAWSRLNFLRVSGISFLVIAGMHDNLVNYLNAGMLADALNAPLILKEDAGHGVNFQYADEINEALVNHIELAETKKIIEGRRPPSARGGYPPGMHPWLTAFLSLIPSYLVARRITSAPRLRRLLVVILVSLILRLAHGPVYRVRSNNDF